MCVRRYAWTIVFRFGGFVVPCNRSLSNSSSILFRALGFEFLTFILSKCCYSLSIDRPHSWVLVLSVMYASASSATPLPKMTYRSENYAPLMTSPRDWLLFLFRPTCRLPCPTNKQSKSSRRWKSPATNRLCNSATHICTRVVRSKIKRKCLNGWNTDEFTLRD